MALEPWWRRKVTHRQRRVRGWVPRSTRSWYPRWGWWRRRRPTRWPQTDQRRRRRRRQSELIVRQRRLVLKRRRQIEINVLGRRSPGWSHRHLRATIGRFWRWQWRRQWRQRCSSTDASSSKQQWRGIKRRRIPHWRRRRRRQRGHRTAPAHVAAWQRRSCSGRPGATSERIGQRRPHWWSTKRRRIPHWRRQRRRQRGHRTAPAHVAAWQRRSCWGRRATHASIHHASRRRWRQQCWW